MEASSPEDQSHSTRKRLRRLMFTFVALTTRKPYALLTATIITAMIVGLDLSLPPSENISVALLFVLPVSLMSAAYGLRGGFAGALFALMLFIALTVVFGVQGSRSTTYVVTPVVLLSFGILFGTYTEREHNLQKALRAEYDLRREAFDHFTHIIAPPKRPIHAPWRVSWQYRPAQELIHSLGGDFLDYEQAEDGTLRFVLGDVSGHGSDAAALGASLRIAWCSLAKDDIDLGELMGKMQGVFHSQRRGDIQFFATVCVGRISSSGEMELVCAGHEPPLLIRDGKAVSAQVEPGPALGLVEAPTWHTTRLSLDENTWLVAFTDGLTEAWVNSADERLGVKRLGRLMLPIFVGPSPDLKLLLDQIEADHGGLLEDDAAVLALCRGCA